MTNSPPTPPEVSSWIAAHRPADAADLCSNAMPESIQDATCAVASKIG